MIADDKEINHIIIKQLLYPFDYSITSVDNGLDAIKKWENNTFDLIILDMKMPKMNGHNCVHKIRNKDPFTPIILMATNPSNYSKQNSLDICVNKVISKPFLPEEVEQITLELINEKEDVLNTIG